jgi:hypothetical protein
MMRTREFDDEGIPLAPLAFVRVDGGADIESVVPAAPGILRIGVAEEDPGETARPLLDSLDCTLISAPASSDRVVAVADLAESMRTIEGAVRRNPRAALTLAQVLRATERLPVEPALTVESFAYSMLLAGGEFARWRTSRPVRAYDAPDSAAVLVERRGDTLEVRLNRPERHNAFDRAIRDGLVDAFELPALDESIERVELSGAGPSFCSGGDLDEFGSAGDVSTAHVIRLERSAALAVHRVRERTRALLHGACIGAGIEVPSFAGNVRATGDAFFQLPEVAMGLIPAAGGLVGVPRRIGRWRTAYLALTSKRIGVDTALGWGLVDERVD